MFLEFYKLREQPFGVTADPRFLYLARSHRETLASLFFAIENRLGFSMLVAEPGLGKTTLLLQVLKALGASALTAFLFETQCNPTGLLRYLLKELDLQTNRRGPTSLHEQLEQLLVRVAGTGRHLVVIIDEAQNLGPPVLETMRLLSNFETRSGKLIHIILSGQPQLAQQFAKPDMAQFEQRISITNWLKPLTTDETARYVEYRLQVAGFRHGPLFSDEAIEAIAARSEGIPRKINRLCFNALSLGCVVQENHIGKELIEEAGSDMGIRLLALQRSSSDSTKERAGESVAKSASSRICSGTDSQQSDEQIFVDDVQAAQQMSNRAANEEAQRGRRMPWNVATSNGVTSSRRRFAGSMLRITLLLISFGVIPLQGQNVSATDAQPSSSTLQFATRNPRYQIRPSDIIEVGFYPTAELNQTLSVEPDGYITLREAGDLHVAGKTVPELKEAITAAYAKLLNEPVITVLLKDFQRPYFIVGGQVGHPGKYELRAQTTASEAVAIAGGLTERAKHTQVLLFRKVSDDWSEVKPLDFKAIYRGNWQEDIHLKPGDMLFVPQNKISKIKPYLPNWSIGTYIGPGVF
jgi:general secretion pathway protein A